MKIYLVKRMSGDMYDWSVRNIYTFQDKNEAIKFAEGATKFAKEHTWGDYNQIEEDFYYSKEYKEAEESPLGISEELRMKLRKLLEPFISPYDGSYPEYDFNSYKIEEIELI